MDDKIIHGETPSGEYRRNWMRNVFMDMLNIDLIKNKRIKELASNLEIHKSHFRRFEKWDIMHRYIMVPGVTKMICTLITISNNRKTANIAYIYSAIHPISKKIIPMYLCTGVNMLSADGEYRGRFIRINNLNFVYYKYPEFTNDIETHIHSKNYEPIINHFHALGILDSLDNRISPYIIRGIMVTWFCEMYLIYFNIQNNHKNPDFNGIMFDDSDIKAFDMLVKKYGLSQIYMFYRRCTTVVYPGSFDEHGVTVKFISERISIAAECGQKLMPLKVSDVLHMMNPTRRVWREIIIWKMVSDLPINMITPGIPVYNMWFAINNSRQKLFDNPYMLQKHNESQRLEQKTNISDVTIAIICESTGSTINNTIIHHRSKDYRSKNKDLFQHPTYFMKYLFEIIYTLYCLNTKMGVIHADLHLNNTTVNSIYFPYFDYELPVLNVAPAKTDHIIYHVGDNMHFMFPHIVKYATVIDFSRAIVKPQCISEHLENKKDKALFMLTQKNQILQWYESHIPELYAEYENEIKTVCDTKFDAVFKLMSAVDMYYHSVLLLKFFKTNKALVKKDESVENVLKKIVVITRHYLENGMKTLAQKNDWVPPEWPNLEIIKRCFSNYMLNEDDEKALDDITLVDYFNYDNPMKYNFHDPKRVPPRFKHVRLASKKWGEPGYKNTTKHRGNDGTYHEERTEYNKSVLDWTNSIKSYTITPPNNDK